MNAIIVNGPLQGACCQHKVPHIDQPGRCVVVVLCHCRNAVVAMMGHVAISITVYHCGSAVVTMVGGGPNCHCCRPSLQVNSSPCWHGVIIIIIFFTLAWSRHHRSGAGRSGSHPGGHVPIIIIICRCSSAEVTMIGSMVSPWCWVQWWPWGGRVLVIVNTPGGDVALCIHGGGGRCQHIHGDGGMSSVVVVGVITLVAMMAVVTFMVVVVMVDSWWWLVSLRCGCHGYCHCIGA